MPSTETLQTQAAHRSRAEPRTSDHRSTAEPRMDQVANGGLRQFVEDFDRLVVMPGSEPENANPTERP